MAVSGARSGARGREFSSQDTVRVAGRARAPRSAAPRARDACGGVGRESIRKEKRRVRQANRPAGGALSLQGGREKKEGKKKHLTLGTEFSGKAELKDCCLL